MSEAPPKPQPERCLEPGRNPQTRRLLQARVPEPESQIKARPRKEDSCEVYVGDEFLGLVYKDEEEGDYNFSMAILDIDLA